MSKDKLHFNIQNAKQAKDATNQVMNLLAENKIDKQLSKLLFEGIRLQVNTIKVCDLEEQQAKILEQLEKLNNNEIPSI